MSVPPGRPQRPAQRVPPSQPTEIVLDASVLAKWFRQEGEPHHSAARQIRRHYVQGALTIVVPSLLYLEILNLAARRWRWPARRVTALAGRLARYGFELDEPPLERVAHWTGRGLTAYDACYLALAEHRGSALATTDEALLATGARFVRSP